MWETGKFAESAANIKMLIRFSKSPSVDQVMGYFADLNSELFVIKALKKKKKELFLLGGTELSFQKKQDPLSCLNCSSSLEIKGHWSQNQESGVCCFHFAANWPVTEGNF